MDEAHEIGAHQDCGGIVMGRPVPGSGLGIGELVPTTYFRPPTIVFWCTKCDQGGAREVRLTFEDGEVRAVTMVGPT